MARILITNDDGIASPGLHALAALAVERGHEVLVAAPSAERSGSGASIAGADEHGDVATEARELEALPGTAALAVDAAPALIALLAVHGALGPVPDLVLSGINRGANVGGALLHSGTAGAALTAGSNGSRGLAVSLDVGLRPDAEHWSTAAEVAARLLDRVLDAPAGTVVNVNAPNTAEAPELRWAPLADFGVVQTTSAEPGEHGVRLAVVDPGAPLEEGTDAALLRAGFATATRLGPLQALPPLD